MPNRFFQKIIFMNTVKMLFARYTSSLTISNFSQILHNVCSIIVWPIFLLFIVLQSLLRFSPSHYPFIGIFNHSLQEYFPILSVTFFLRKTGNLYHNIMHTMYVYARVSLCIIVHYFSFNISFNVIFIELDHDLLE